MPRAIESFEQRVLNYFQSAHLTAATLLLSLAVAAVKSRKPKGPAKGVKKVHLVEEVVQVPVVAKPAAKKKKRPARKAAPVRKGPSTPAGMPAGADDLTHLEGEEG